MFSCGLPAKSGVGGGIMGVLPGAFGIAAFSPPIDSAGNSVRAQLAIRYIMEELRLHIFDCYKAVMVEKEVVII
jgi:glutaminase